MDWWLAIILGILQGITEWLPISSSGHLAIFQHYFDEEPPILFDVILHLGSLFVVSYILRKELMVFLEAIPSTLRKIKGKSTFNDDERLVLLVVIASIPTAFIGLLFDGEIIENFYDKMYLVGFCLMITGVVIWYSKEHKNALDFANLSFLKAFYIGIVQGLSILPGISRSGTTIAFLRIFGLEPIKAAKFSFLIFIPAIIGATFLKLNEAEATLEEVGLISIILGFSASVISSFLSIKFLLTIINNQKFHYFTPYCLIVGIFLVFDNFYNLI
ncbi:MAG: undecaprenyl-diphosphate phosphatase [Candidatus Thermoplasmatota archaeon]|nr:undecaprenyl-diphosphate phosphatase [Candidatus Thermoplasmatota archaeon]